jgi:hypothetical protein
MTINPVIVHQEGRREPLMTLDDVAVERVLDELRALGA